MSLRRLFRPTSFLLQHLPSNPLAPDYFSAGFSACVKFNDLVVSLPPTSTPQHVLSVFLSTAYAPEPRQLHPRIIRSPGAGLPTKLRPKSVPNTNDTMKNVNEDLAETMTPEMEQSIDYAAKNHVGKPARPEPRGVVKASQGLSNAGGVNAAGLSGSGASSSGLTGASWPKVVRLHGGKRVIKVSDPPPPDFDFNDVNFSTTLAKVRDAAARRGGLAGMMASRAELELLLKLIELNINMFAPRSLSTVTSALVSLGLNRHHLFGVVAEQAMVRMTDFNTHDLAALSWSYARAGQSHEELFRAIDKHSRKMAHFALGPDLTAIIWAFAKTGFGTPSLFAVYEKAFKKLYYLNSQALATVVWSWAKLGIPSPTLFSFVEQKMMGVVRNYEPQTISNVIWAYGKARIAPKALLERLTSQALQKVDGLLPQHLANISWALSALNVKSPALMKEIRERATKRINDFTIMSVAEISVAYATETFPPSPDNNPLFLAVVKNVSDMQKKIQDRDKILPVRVLTELTWAFATQRVITEPLLQFLTSQLTHHVTAASPATSLMHPKNAMDAAWGFYQLNRNPEAELAALEAKVEAYSDDDLNHVTTPSRLVAAVWALSLNRTPSQTLLAKAIKTVNGLAPASLPPPALVHLSHLHLASKAGLLSLPVPLSPAWQNEAQEALRVFEREQMEPMAKLLDDAASYLRTFLEPGLKAAVETRYVTPEGFGLQLVVPQKKFVFELLPNHYFIKDLLTQKKWPSGENRTRSELLKRHGWKVASLHEHAWTSLKSDKKQELALRLTSVL